MLKQRAVFFDVDATFFRKHLSSLLFHELVRDGLLSPNDRTVLNALEAHSSYRKRIGTWEMYDECLMRVYYGGKSFSGISVSHVERLAQVVVEQNGDYINLFPRILLDACRVHEYLPVLVSGSPSVIVKELAKRHLIHHWHGTTLPAEGDRYTGDANEAWKYDKGSLLLQIAEELNIDLSESIAIGDGSHDIRMLDKVGWPIPYRPCQSLASSIKDGKKTWPTVLEDRSVIALRYAGSIRVEVRIADILPRGIGEYVEQQLEKSNLLG